MKTLVLSAASLIFHTLLIAQTTAPKLPVCKNKMVVIAHRGNHVTVPENTVASIEAAYQCGADYAELDLRTSKDGHLVLIHDATVNSTTTAQGKVADMTLSQLRQLPLKSKDGKAYQIPTFAEALAAAKGKIHIYLDFKEADVTETWKQIQQAGMEKQVVVYLNKIEQYHAWKAIAQHLPLMTSLPEAFTTPAQMEAFLDTVSVAVLDNINTAALLATARKRNVAVWLDAQSSSEGPEVWNAVIGKGAQGMQSDNPGALVSYLRKKKLR